MGYIVSSKNSTLLLLSLAPLE